jgi:hypothetical protein
MSFVDHYLLYFRERLITGPLLVLLPFQPLFSECSHGYQLLAPPPSSGAFTAPCPLCCVLVFSSLFIVQFCFFFCWVGGSVCPGGYVGLSQGWLGKYCMMLGAHLFGLPNVSQAGLEPASGSTGALLFSQCNIAWRSFAWASGSECRSFNSSWCLISTKCGFSISSRFLIYGAHSVCFCALVAILDPPPKLKKIKKKISETSDDILIELLWRFHEMHMNSVNCIWYYKHLFCSNSPRSRCQEGLYVQEDFRKTKDKRRFWREVPSGLSAGLTTCEEKRKEGKERKNIKLLPCLTTSSTRLMASP